jgi:hypothetical protein
MSDVGGLKITKATSMAEPEVPRGWKPRSQEFSIKLKPGKPPGAMQWQDIQGRPVVRSGRAWKLVRTNAQQAPNNRNNAGNAGKQQQPEQDNNFKLNEAQVERINNATRSTNNRINRKLGKGPFDDEVDTSSEKYKENIEKMKPYMALSDEQKSSISLYGQDGVQFYAMLNKQLRTGSTEGLSPEDVEMNKFIHANLRKGLEQLSPKEGQLHRALSGDVVSQLQNLKPGDIYEDKGYGSYSDQEKSIQMFIKKDAPNAIITINSKTARNVSPIMEYDEGEHIALPGSKYKLAKIGKTYSKKLNSNVPQYIFEEI